MVGGKYRFSTLIIDILLSINTCPGGLVSVNEAQLVTDEPIEAVDQILELSTKVVMDPPAGKTTEVPTLTLVLEVEGVQKVVGEQLH